MNRYRTAPGLGPSKATTATTCQKCLKKGHYSYECKESLQSRPYVSRASRTQQLRNPKLKPDLTETKLDEQPDSKDLYKPDKPKVSGTRTRSLSAEPPAKRMRRSVSLSSASSVSTISTAASQSKPERSARRSPSPVRQRRRQSPSPSESRSRSPSLDRRRKSPITSRSRSPPRLVDSDHARRRRRGSRERRSRDVEHSPVDDQSPDRGRRGGMGPPHQTSRIDRNHPDQRHPWSNTSAGGPKNRARSLSPYSRRLALTQAMNAGP